MEWLLAKKLQPFLEYWILNIIDASCLKEIVTKSVPDLGGSNPDKQWFSVLVLLLENRFCSLRILAISSPIVLWIVSHGTLCKLLSSRPDASSHRSSLFFPVWPPLCNIWYTSMLGKNKHLYTNLNILYLLVLPPGPQCTRLHPSFQLSWSTLNLLKSSTPIIVSWHREVALPL